MHGLAAFCMILVLQASHGHSLLDAARRDGGTATVVVAIESRSSSLSTLATESDVILRGIVSRVTTRLSDNEERVMTQFEITPVEVYKGSVAPVASAPGPTKALIVERAGGELTIDGLRLRTVVDVFPETESLHQGENVFLFLSRDATTGIYALTNGPFGAYRIADGKVIAMTRESAERRGEEPQSSEAFESRVLGVIRK